MSRTVSVRLDSALAQRLRIRADAAGESLSDRLRRYAEEGARRDEFPMITFRDGPTGRRAGVVGGPDIWEIALWVDDLAADTTSDPAAVVAQEMSLPRGMIDTALAYRSAYPDEIEARLRLHHLESEAAGRAHASPDPVGTPGVEPRR